MKKQLDQTREFNTTAGIDLPSSLTFPTRKRISLCISLIQEEMGEILEAYNNLDKVEVIDGLADLQYVVNGLINAFGADELMEEALQLVHESNMSKFCKTEEEATATIEDYKKKGIDTHAVLNGDLFVVRRNSDNKILKNINYKPVDLKKIVK